MIARVWRAWLRWLCRPPSGMLYGRLVHRDLDLKPRADKPETFLPARSPSASAPLTTSP